MIIDKSGKAIYHPGELLGEFIEAQGFKHKEFAERAGISEKHLCNLLNCSATLSIDVAMKICAVLNENNATWINIQKEYSLAESELKRASTIDEYKGLIKLFPIADMIHYNLIKKVTSIQDKANELLSFFKIADIQNLQSLPTRYYPRYRKLNKTENISTKEQAADAVLCRWGEIIAEKKGIQNKFTVKKLDEAISHIRASLCCEVSDFAELVENELNKAGIAFVLTPKISAAKASGLSYMCRGTPVVHITDRKKALDTFIFTLFHELYHVKQGLEGKENEAEDLEADEFSKHLLISPEMWADFLNKRAIGFSFKIIQSFAIEANVPVSCVVGRLKKEGLIPYSQFSNCQNKIEVKISSF